MKSPLAPNSDNSTVAARLVTFSVIRLAVLERAFHRMSDLNDRKHKSHKYTLDQETRGKL